MFITLAMEPQPRGGQMTITEGDVRRLRPVDPPLGSYLRPFRRDLSHLAQLIAEDLHVGSGVVLDPVVETQSLVLRQEALRAGVEVVLDSRAMELATEGGFDRRALRTLSWAGDEIHRPAMFTRSDATGLI